MVGLSHNGFQESQAPWPELIVQLPESGRLFPVDPREVGGDLDNLVANNGGNQPRSVVGHGRDEWAPTAVMADDEVDQEIGQQGVEIMVAHSHPMTHQASRQILVAAATGPSRRLACSGPTMSRRAGLGEEPSRPGLGIKPPLKARLGLARIVQEAGEFQDFDQFAGDSDTLRDQPRTGSDGHPVRFKFDGACRKRSLVKFIAPLSCIYWFLEHETRDFVG